VLGAASLAQAVEHLVLACGPYELVIASSHLGLAALNFLGSLGMAGLDALEEGLAALQLDRAQGPGRRIALFGAGALELHLGALERGLRAGQARDRASQLLLGELLLALTHRAHTLKAKPKRGTGHGSFIGLPAPAL